METVTLRIESDGLGVDREYPEAFAAFCRERLRDEYPGAEIHIEIDSGTTSMPDDSIDESALWDEYCSLPRQEYVRLSNRIPSERRAAYLERVAR